MTNTLIDLFNDSRLVSDWQSNFNKNYRQLVMGLSDSAKAIVMATALDGFLAQKILVVTSNQNEAEKLSANLSSLLGEEKVYHFFADDIAAAEFIPASREKIQSRVRSLNFLQDKDKDGILILSIQACQIRLPNPERYKISQLSLQVGVEIELDKLVKKIFSIGYIKTSQVVNQGEFSLRGDILDIFPLGSTQPYRIEFFGDEVDSIRTFDILTQISMEKFEQASITPASDMILDDTNYQSALDKLTKFTDTCQDANLVSYLWELISTFKNKETHPDQRKFLSYFYERDWTILDYLPEKCLIFYDDFHKIQDSYARFEQDVAEFLTANLQNSKAIPDQAYFAKTYTSLKQYRPSSFFSSFQRGLGSIKFDALFQFNQHNMQDFLNQIPLLKEEIRRFEKSGYTVLIQADSEHTLQSLQKTLQEYDLTIPVSNQSELLKGETQLHLGYLATGFNFIDEKIALITEQDIFRKKVKRKLRSTNLTNAERLRDYNELEKGDYVVHNVHGIGRFLGIETIEISGIHRDYLTIQYQNSDRISLPVDQIELLSKYIASDDKEPRINKLNDGRFQKTKQRVQKQVEDIADDLIKLYAERSQLKGFAFSSDDENQDEFEEAFPYIETDDQLRSIKEVKRDMEAQQPMDRLLVGDVGFGKTEVAMRAAFKAVNDHKQVAILVPTTVLAQQHYNNFIERFFDFPVNIEVLSRFRTKSQQTEILEGLKKGQIDIIIGTHRLLSKDVVFSDLGLIVVDEEQRFGVKHKETLKKLKIKVDVLTLTATPIPRTLHMSMLGIRDLSIIETPPINRYPVQTYVMETNQTLIRDAILRELDRGGQVFYLYNRVDSIEQKVTELRDLVPEANIGFVHGKMSEIQLENTLISFVDGDYDILVTTTIIETGIDIPNANTLFIEDADRMGLSTLYQLRGRVGRTNRLAYAYLMYKPDKSLTEVAEKRLEAIKGFTELGSGFKIAMQDLSIRGAGNILGSSQSGFIDSVGFEMYSQLLEEAIAIRQGKEQKRHKSNSEINLQIDAYLPSDYIGDERQKIEIYKRIREIDSRVNYENLQDELIDRFGDYPDAVAYLLEIGLLKYFSDQIFTKTIELKQGKVLFTFEKKAGQFFLTQDYFKALSFTSLKARISEEKGCLQVIFDVRQKKDFEILEEVMIFCEQLMVLKTEETGDRGNLN